MMLHYVDLHLLKLKQDYVHLCRGAQFCFVRVACLENFLEGSGQTFQQSRHEGHVSSTYV